MCRCCTEPIPAMDRTRRCSGTVWKHWANYTMLWMTPNSAIVPPAALVRDGGSWSEQLELDLDVEGYYTLISLTLSHSASQLALWQAAGRGAMKSLGGKL